MNRKSSLLTTTVFLFLTFGLLTFAQAQSHAFAKSQGPSADLEISVNPAETFVLPVGIQTCQEIVSGSNSISLSSASVRFRKLNIKWKKDETFEAVLIRMTFTSDALKGGSQEVVIAGEELDAVLTHHGQTPIFSGAGEYVSHPACGLRAGNLVFNPTAPDSKVRVEIELLGIVTDANGDSSPVYQTTEALAQYLAN